MSSEVKEDIEREYPELLEAYEHDEFVPGAERYEDLILRVKMMVEKIQEFKEKKVLCVTHGNFLKAFVKEMMPGLELDKKEDCGLMEVEIKDGKVKHISSDGITIKESSKS